MMTMGVAALAAEAIARIVKTIEVYDDFCHANNSYEEHDFGSFEGEGLTILFKLDYYDPKLPLHSPDPSDQPSQSASSPSCWRRSHSRAVKLPAIACRLSA